MRLQPHLLKEILIKYHRILAKFVEILKKFNKRFIY